MKRRFDLHGWTKLPLLDQAMCDQIRNAFDTEVKPYTGSLKRQLTSIDEPHQLSADGWMTNPVVNPHLRHQFPAFSGIEREAMTASVLVQAVGALLGCAPAMLQSAYYESSRGTHTHLDFNPVVRDRPMVGVWIALEDIGPDAGRFFLYPDSHTLPDTPELQRFAELAWANYRQAFVDLDLDTAETESQRLLADLVATHQLRPITPALKAGDALFWTNRVLHGSHVPKPGGGTRNSLLFHFIEGDLVEEKGLDVH